jgi:hypothetical protein
VGVAGVVVGYVIGVAGARERTLARALQIEAATRERERLARDIHDGVLQVLAMVQRRGRQAGGEAAELGRLAGEQEAALRTLITGGPGARPACGARDPAVAGPGGAVRPEVTAGGDGRETTRTATATAADGQETWDLGAVLGGWAGPRVTVSAPGTPVPLAAHAAAEVSAAVGAALDNVRAHAGEQARAWILVEDEPGTVVVTVRDDGPGIADGRLAAAEAEGRLGVAQSIRGRLRDLGGTAELVSVPGQGTEVELRLPRTAPAAAAPPALGSAPGRAAGSRAEGSLTAGSRTAGSRTALVAGALRALGAAGRPRGNRTGAGPAPAAGPGTGTGAADPDTDLGTGTGMETGAGRGTETGTRTGTTTSTSTGTGGRGTR